MNRIRSANAPVISAGVIIANFSWNIANKTNGIVGNAPQAIFPNVPFIIKNVRGSPIIPPISSPKAKLNPTITQRIVIRHIQIKLCIIVEITFFLLTIPP
ncbi:hypothetical protein D3C86_1828810 [compost metagenome]